MYPSDTIVGQRVTLVNLLKTEQAKQIQSPLIRIAGIQVPNFVSNVGVSRCVLFSSRDIYFNRCLPLSRVGTPAVRW